ncbi:hypothetical protein S40293_09767 [Stachybotrys chartarum IBT 40293]|nr:hypothetical protein S40293_09767 [Stachybotrys chartarum IBT 40293]
MEAALDIVIIGSVIGVDEAVQGFQGRSSQIVTIKTKPTPTGLKIWVLAVKGYILQWIWHKPGSQYGPVGIEGRRGPKVKASDKPPALNPTQAVVVALVNQIAWKDNALVLFLTTVYDGSETTVCLRKRPKGGQPYSRPIRRFFGDKGVKEIEVIIFEQI